MNEETEGEGAAPKERPGAFNLVLTAVIGGLVACGVSYLDPFGGEPPAEDEVEIAEEAPSPAVFVVAPLDPVTISLAADDPARRRAPRLRLSLALEVEEGAAKHAEEEAARLRDGVVAAARSLGPEVLAGPEGLDALREAILGRTKEILGDGAVSGVLITDYVIA
jgi:flagellar basal body-associated protein FliL